MQRPWPSFHPPSRPRYFPAWPSPPEAWYCEPTISLPTPPVHYSPAPEALCPICNLCHLCASFRRQEIQAQQTASPPPRPLPPPYGSVYQQQQPTTYQQASRPVARSSQREPAYPPRPREAPRAPTPSSVSSTRAVNNELEEQEYTSPLCCSPRSSCTGNSTIIERAIAQRISNRASRESREVATHDSQDDTLRSPYMLDQCDSE